MSWFQECDEVDPRFSSQGVRDTSFSWESIDSQVGSKQSLLDNKGRSRLLKSQEAKVLSGGQAWTGGGHCTGGGQSPGDRRGNAGDRGQTDDMDLTRRQREQRKKDIREQVSIIHNQLSMAINIVSHSHSTFFICEKVSLPFTMKKLFYIKRMFSSAKHLVLLYNCS